MYKMRNIIIQPHSMVGRCMCMKGTGMGSVLLNTNIGVGSTYTSAAPSPGDLGQPKMDGGALSKNIAAKLDKLRVNSRRKPENIKFSI